jgi:peptidoglycan/LPS O-acetylase OafA/YrhL
MTDNISAKTFIHQDGSRLLFMDGLRGIAIMLVFLYHGFSDLWENFTPYGDKFNHFFLFRYGEYGVPLFFLISGFVITLTLEKCQSFGGFMLRRWLRLFPAMLIATVIIFIMSHFINQRPYGPPILQDAISGLLFIQPELIDLLVGRNQRMLEPSFWSLFVEMKFYFVSGFLYFAFGRKRMIVVLICMYLSYVVFDSTKNILPVNVVETIQLFFRYSDYSYYGWFAAGALFYEYHNRKEMKYWLLAVMIALLSARGLGGLMTESMLFATAIVLLFAYSLKVSLIQKLLSNKLLIFFGFISYPLYLIHVSSLVSMISQLHTLMPSIPHWFLPIMPIGLLSGIAWVIATYLEPRLRDVIKAYINKINFKLLFKKVLTEFKQNKATDI